MRENLNVDVRNYTFLEKLEQLPFIEKLWLRMFDDRNFTSHNYGQESADDVYARIKTYYPEMKAVYEKLKQLSIDP